jgi:hypothetical protein
MQQVSGLDATFLFLETQNAPMHIGSVGIFDPSTAPDGIVRFKRIIQTVEERAHLAPYLRQRLVEVPFNADFPYWVRDESFDPEFHIRHIAHSTAQTRGLATTLYPGSALASTRT